MTDSSLLPLRRGFLGRLTETRDLAYPFFRGIFPRSALSGPPAEFDGHRPYLPGDDTRWIDWNLYARLEELYVKVYQVEEEVEVLLLVDGSLSMTSAGGIKYHRAAATAAALFYLAVLTAHPATVVRYTDRVVDSKGPHRHLMGFPALTDLLRSPPPGGGTDLRQALAPVLAHRRRAVTVVVLSDGFQREPIDRIVSSLMQAAHRRFVFLRILDEKDVRPKVRGNVLLEDLEGGGGRALLSDRALEKQLHRKIENHFRDLEQTLQRSGADSHTLPVAGDFEGDILSMLLHFSRSVPGGAAA